MKEVFITGGAGFIGRELVGRLEKHSDIELYIISRQRLPDRGNIRYITCDISDREKLSEIIKKISPTDLIHLAWDVKSAGYAASATNDDWTLYSEDLLKSFLENGGRNVIVSGTCFEYDLSSNLPLNESSPCNPNTPYGKAKVKTAAIYEKLCKEHNARMVWGRIFYPYGEGEEKRKLLSAVAESLKNDRPFECKNPNNEIDYICVSDIAKIFEEFLLNEKAEGVINVGTGKAVKVGEILQKIAHVLGKGEELLKFSDSPAVKIVADTKKLSTVFDCNSLTNIDEGLEYVKFI